jgi:hypothetical protein
MRVLTFRWLGAIILAIFCLAIPTPSFAGVFIGISITTPPPALPVYTQPMVPGPNYIWMPGYWAWGAAGYYWVPGTWVLAPRPGLLWTPGYWGWAPAGYYAWHPGYWAPHVGFYGGINYGFGYFGVGYVGGGWFGGVFRYNVAVTNVDRTIVRNVYVDRTVVVNNTTVINRVSYNGGRGGVFARPTPQELVAQHEVHVPMTAEQRQHVSVASRDRNQLASVNQGHPGQLSAAHAFTNASRPADFTRISPEDRAATQPYRASAQRAPAQSYRATGEHAPRPVRTVQPQNAQRAARSSNNVRSRTFPARNAARSNSARASVHRPNFSSRSPRTLGNR